MTSTSCPRIGRGAARLVLLGVLTTALTTVAPAGPLAGTAVAAPPLLTPDLDWSGDGRNDVNGVAAPSGCTLLQSRMLADGGHLATSRCGFEVERLVLTRITASGAVDTAYGDDVTGHVSIPARLTSPALFEGETPDTTVIGADGSAFVTWAVSDGGDRQYRLLRVGPDGTIDATYGTAGVAAFVVPGQATASTFLADIDASGAVVFGLSRSTTSTTFVRIAPNGTLDTGFDGDGILTRPGSLAGITFAALAPDGRFTWARLMQFDVSDPLDVFLERRLPTGALDTSWANAGTRFYGPVPDDGDGFVQVTERPGGAGLVLTIVRDHSNDTLVVLDANGFLDGGFNGSGVLIHPTAVAGHGTVIDSTDGSIVTWESTGSNQFRIVRVSADGATITSTDVDLADEAIDGLQLLGNDSAGRMLALGWWTQPPHDPNQPVAIRFTPSFALDTTYGSGTGPTAPGIERFQLLSSQDGVLLTDSRIRAATDGLIVQMGAGGELDPTFGDGGTARFDIPSGSDDDQPRVAHDDTGRTVVAFASSAGNSWASVARFDLAGMRDTTFGTGGVASVDASVPVWAMAGGVSVELVGLDSQHRPYVMLRATYDVGDGPTELAEIVRLTAAGDVDPGYARPDLPGASVVHLADNGTALVHVGTSLRRLLPNGTIDPSFDTGSEQVEWPRRATVAADGSIVSCGASRCIALSSTGVLDTAFGSAGRVALPAMPSEQPTDITTVIEAEFTAEGGVVLLVDHDDSNADPVARHVVRLLPDGRLDPTFGVGGIVTLPTPPDEPLGGDAWYQLEVVRSGIAVITVGDPDAAPATAHQILRLDETGAIDASFGGDGFAAVPRPPESRASSMSIERAGDELVVWEPNGVRVVAPDGAVSAEDVPTTALFTVAGALAVDGDAISLATVSPIVQPGFAAASYDIEVRRYTIDDTTSSRSVTATADATTTGPGTAVTLDVRANDGAVATSLARPVLVGDPQHGAVSVLPGGDLRYEPDAGWLGSDRIDYRVCSVDDSMSCAVATLTVQTIAPTPPSTPPAPPSTPTRAIEVVAPDRLFDSRPGEPQGAISVTKQKYGGPDVLRVRVTGVSGIPSSGVAAVSLNITAVDGDAPGYLTLYPCGDRPTVSSVNFTPATVIANAVIVPVSADGDLCIASNTRTHVVADVNGWFRTGSGFAAVAPRRLADTRTSEADGAIVVPKQRYGGATVLRLPVGGVAGVPASGVGAVSLNVTAVGPAAAGFLTVFTCGELPLASSVNFVAGQVVANAVIAPVSAGGEVCIYSNAPTDIVVDVNGWFATGAGFTAVAPARLFDTRPSEPQGAVAVEQAPIGPTRALRVRVTGVAGVPGTGVGAVSLNVTVDRPTGAGFVTVYPCGAVPPTSNVNFAAGQVVPNAVVAPVSDSGEICLVSSVGTHVLADVNGWFLAGAAG